MIPRAPTTVAVILAFLGAIWVLPFHAASAQGSNVFQSFTSHIERQVTVDKKFFVDASSCTEWFYKQERGMQSPPKAQGIALHPEHMAAGQPSRPLLMAVDCNSRYPGGINAARKDFSRSQTTLSLSLTFYEFALVGDANDDGHYSDAELRDVVESFGITYHPERSPARQLSTLNAQFDSIHQALQFDMLMTGMQMLYDRGYRFTQQDKIELNRIMG